MVTPEMLLWLAGKMGVAVEMRGPFICLAHGGRGYVPHADDAQFGRLVVWAAMQGLEPMLTKHHAIAGSRDSLRDSVEAHNNTPDSIRAAAVVAVCRALGWEGKE